MDFFLFGFPQVKELSQLLKCSVCKLMGHTVVFDIEKANLHASFVDFLRDPFKGVVISLEASNIDDRDGGFCGGITSKLIHINTF
jgi:hypothetical protein